MSVTELRGYRDACFAFCRDIHAAVCFQPYERTPTYGKIYSFFLVTTTVCGSLFRNTKLVYSLHAASQVTMDLLRSDSGHHLHSQFTKARFVWGFLCPSQECPRLFIQSIRNSSSSGGVVMDLIKEHTIEVLSTQQYRSVDLITYFIG